MRTLTKFCFAVVPALLFVGGFCASSFAGPERMDSKDKMVMAPPPECDPRWYISIGGSVDPDLGSSFTSGNDDSFSISGLNFEADVKGRDYDDIYNNWWNVRGEFGYVLTSHIEIFGRFEYTHADSQLIGGFLPGSPDNKIFVSGQTLAHDLNLESRWDDYDSFGGEIGIRYFFLNKEAKVRPFVSVSGGAAWVQAIGLQVDTETLGGFEGTIYKGGFYDDTIVPVVSGLIGVEFKVTCHLAIGLDAGVKWTGELDQDDSDFITSIALGGATAISGFDSREVTATHRILKETNNDGADRLSFPVTVYAKFRF